MSKWTNDLGKTFKKAFSFTKVKAEEYGKIGKAKGEIVILKQKQVKLYGELGETVRPLIEKDKKSAIANHESVKDVLKKLTDIEKSMKAKEKEIDAAKKEAEEKSEKQAVEEKKEQGDNN
jgi:hypothetical protein